MISLRRLASGAAMGAIVCALSTAAFAQETTSAIHGMVTTDGAPVSNASVTVLHKPSGSRVVVSTKDGAFDARGLRVGGPYTITVTSPGAAPKTIDNVYLQVSQTAGVDIDLTAANEVEAVVVTATAGQKNTDQGPKTVLGRADIQEVVTITRDPRDLARRDMLVAQDLNSSARVGVNGGGLSIAGSNPRYNRIAVDGVSAQDNFGLNQGGMTTARGPVTLDAIEQFAVAAVPTDVENGDFVGGALNLVLRSGTNKFHGVLFDNYLNDGMVGKKIEGNRIVQAIHQKNYGGFLSGPIWKDHLFFAVSYEKYTTVDQGQFGVPGSGAPNIFQNSFTQTTLDQVLNAFKAYGSKFDPGSILPTTPVLDKKYSAKIDWNIMEGQRASFTYRYAKSANVLHPNIQGTQVQLSSQDYTRQDVDKAYTFELNSTWSDRFSTRFKATKREYVDTQSPPSGQNFSDVRVCTAPNSDNIPQTCPTNFDQVFFGPDQFRHANTLAEKELRFQFVGEYSLAPHQFKFGGQARQAKPLDLFVPQSRGIYYFDSLADFAAGRASELQYQNSITGNPSDAQFSTTYWTYSVYAQDTLDVTDNLKVAAGVRYDWYSEPDKPIRNPNFLARYGFTNQKTIDKLHVLMPRVSAEWRATPDLKISGGFGLFAGGTPDVLTGTPFYNTGYATTNVDIRRQADGTFIDTLNTPGFTQAIGATALNNLTADPNFGFTIPAVVRQLQQGTLTGTPSIPPLGTVVALSPTFQLPSVWKAFASGQWNVWKGWQLGVDVVASETQNDFTFYDLRATPLIINGQQQFLPDGRIRYDGLPATTPGKTPVTVGSGNDLIEGTTHKGHSYTAAVSVSKSWDWGGDLTLGYAHQKLRDMTSGLFFGTTTGSLYNSVAAGQDPNRDYLGRSVYEIPNRYKIEAGFHKKFFGDNETRISLFAERQDGRPFGFIMSDLTSGRGPVFGVTRTAQALYVPDFAGHTNPADLNVGFVTFATAADLANFQRYVTNFKLNPGLVPKYSNRNAPVGRLDLSLSQQLPTLIEGHKLRVQFDIRNVLNLLNSKWGQVAEYTSGDGQSNIKLASVQCADANGNPVAANSPVCVRYRYSNVPTSVPKTRNSALSLWYMQVSLRYEF